jgi:ribosomal protein S18 acetylase RimI-like enzyme
VNARPMNARPIAALPTLPSLWQTERLSVRDSVLDDLPELEAVAHTCLYVNEWTGWRAEEHPGESLRCAVSDGLPPPNGSKELYRMQTIRLRSTERAIGFAGCYHGWPEPDTFYVTEVMIDAQFQGQGYGQELARGLTDQVAQLGAYRRICLLAALKNWPALRFWMRAGFDRMVDYKGDKRHSPETFAYLMLEKALL